MYRFDRIKIDKNSLFGNVIREIQQNREKVVYYGHRTPVRIGWAFSKIGCDYHRRYKSHGICCLAIIKDYKVIFVILEV